MDPPAALTLVVEKGPRKGETVECRPGKRVRIGRVVKGNTFTIKDAGISQAHLLIEVDPGGVGWAVTDLGSSNGTLVNGVRIEPSAPSALRDGDVIKIGEESAIRVGIAEVEASAAPPAAAGRRRNPRRGCNSVAVEAPPEEGRGAACGRGRPRRRVGHSEVGADDKERTDLTEEESVKERRETTAPRRGRRLGGGRARGRGRAASKKAAACPSSLDSFSEESAKEESEVMENSDCCILKEVKKEISDSAQIISVKGPWTAVGSRRGALRGPTAAAGAPEEEQARVVDEMVSPSRREEDVAGAEDERVSPLRREEEDVAGANPDVEEGGVDMENSDCCILKEVKQEISDSAQIMSVKGQWTAVRRGRGAIRGDTAAAGAPEEEQARVEDERVSPLRREEEDVAGANPVVEEGGVDMENMTLEEWFDRMEKYLPRVINGIAAEIISEMKATAERFNEYVGNGLDPEQRDKVGGFIGLM